MFKKRDEMVKEWDIGPKKEGRLGKNYNYYKSWTFL